MVRSVCCVLVLWSACLGSWGQVLSRRPSETHEAATPPASPALSSAAVVVPLTIPAGTPIKVIVDREVRVRRVGQLVEGKVAEPVYAFDKLLIPAGTSVSGSICSIASVPKKQRALAALNADFSPPHRLRMCFDELTLPDRRRIPIQTTVSEGAGDILKFVSATQPGNTKATHAAKSRPARAAADISSDLKGQLRSVKRLVVAPAKGHRLKQFALAQSPYRRQYLPSGTVLDASLSAPIDFGKEQLPPELLAPLGSKPPSGSMVHARLITPLTSATSKRGDPVNAVITEPVMASQQILFPQGSQLQGTVLQARPARWLSHGGQLRITFREIVPPTGPPRQTESSLKGVSVADNEHLVLDAEGGAQTAQPKSRYFRTALSLVIASSTGLDNDAGKSAATNGSGDVGKGAVAGTMGFRLVGAVLSIVSKSRVVSSGLGFYGAAASVYSHFLARGREVVYPKNTSMLIELGDPHSVPTNSH